MCPALAQQPSEPDDGAAARVLVERARRLRESLEARPSAPLRGRHVAIAAETHDSPSARLFERAAATLGARVSHIRPDVLALDAPRQEVAARLLGSLYDAIDFIPLAPDRAQSLQHAAGVPIFADLGGDRSPLRALLPVDAESAEREAQLLALVQVMLVDAMR